MSSPTAPGVVLTTLDIPDGESSTIPNKNKKRKTENKELDGSYWSLDKNNGGSSAREARILERQKASTSTPPPLSARRRNPEVSL